MTWKRTEFKINGPISGVRTVKGWSNGKYDLDQLVNKRFIVSYNQLAVMSFGNFELANAFVQDIYDMIQGNPSEDLNDVMRIGTSYGGVVYGSPLP